MILCHSVTTYFAASNNGDLWKIIAVQIITVSLAIFIFYLNRAKERRIIRDRLKAEVGGVCDRIMRHHGAIEACTIQHYYNGALSRFPQSEFTKSGLASEAKDFLTRTNDISMTLFLTKSELIEKVSHLRSYLSDANEIERLTILTRKIHNHTIQKDKSLSKKYIEAATSEQINAILEEDMQRLNFPKGDTPIQKLCIAIQMIVNPDFYRQILDEKKNDEE